MKNQKMISIIVTFGADEVYIDNCLKAIVDNTEKDSVQVILANTRASAECLTIVKNYVDNNDNFELINGGDTKAKSKNIAMSKAIGKYIMFIDPAEILLVGTIDNIVSYYETCADRVSMLLYNMHYVGEAWDESIDEEYSVREELVTQFNSSNLYQKDGMYKVGLHPYSITFHQNYVVKNEGENTLRFNETLSQHNAELQFFMNNIARNPVVAYSHSEGVVRHSHFDKESIAYSTELATYEESIQLYEELLKTYQQFNNYNICAFCKAILLKELNRKLVEGRLVSEECQSAHFESYQRYLKLIDQIEFDVISKVYIAKVNKFYFMSLKKEKLTFLNDSISYGLFDGDTQIALWKHYGAYIDYFKVKEGKLSFTVSFCNSGAVFWDFDVYMSENGKKRKKVKLQPSSLNYAENKEGKANQYSFHHVVDLYKTQELKFSVKINGKFYPVKFFTRNNLPYSGDYLREPIFSGDFLVYVQGGKITREYLNLFARLKEKRMENTFYKENLSAEEYQLRKQIIRASKKNRDQSYVYIGKPETGDVAWDKYCTEKALSDGNKRTFISVRNCEETEESILSKSSEKAKVVFSSATKVYTSRTEFKSYCPFSSAEAKKYRDLWKFDFIYICKEETDLSAWSKGSELYGIEYILVQNERQEKLLQEQCGYRSEQIIK